MNELANDEYGSTRVRAPHWPSERPSLPTSKMQYEKSQEDFEIQLVWVAAFLRRSGARASQQHHLNLPTRARECGVLSSDGLT